MRTPGAMSLLLVALAACSRGYDSSYAVDVAQPAYTASHPVVLFDQAHHNHHRTSTTYHPFAELLEKDGYRVVALREKVTPSMLASAQVLAVVTAMGEDDA